MTLLFGWEGGGKISIKLSRVLLSRVISAYPALSGGAPGRGAKDSLRFQAVLSPATFSYSLVFLINECFLLQWIVTQRASSVFCHPCLVYLVMAWGRRQPLWEFLDACACLILISLILSLFPPPEGHAR